MPRRSTDPTIHPRILTIDVLRRDFAKRLQDILSERGWSQSDLARACWGQTESGAARGLYNISAWVNALALPSPKHLQEVCNALGVDQEDLVPAGMRAAKTDGMHAASTGATEPLKMVLSGDGMAHIEVNADMTPEAALKIYEIVRKATDETRS